MKLFPFESLFSKTVDGTHVLEIYVCFRSNCLEPLFSSAENGSLTFFLFLNFSALEAMSFPLVTERGLSSYLLILTSIAFDAAIVEIKL